MEHSKIDLEHGQNILIQSGEIWNIGKANWENRESNFESV
jgi:hypothetical protein